MEARTGKLVPYVFHREGRPLNAPTNGPYHRPFKLAAEKAGVLGADGIAKIPHDFCRSAAKRYE